MTPATSTSTHGDLRERMSQACHHCGFWTFADLLAAVQTDWWIRIPAIRLAEAHAKAASGTYMYEFAWPSPGLGAVHALEIPFVFDNLGKDTPLVGPLLGDNPPQELANRMHASWIAFATNGAPGWPAYDATQGHHALRRDLAGGRRPPSLGEGPVGGSPLTRSEPIRRAQTRWFLRGNGRSVTNTRVRRTHRHP